MFTEIAICFPPGSSQPTVVLLNLFTSPPFLLRALKVDALLMKALKLLVKGMITGRKELIRSGNRNNVTLWRKISRTPLKSLHANEHPNF